MADKFISAIDKFVLDSEAKILAVVKDSIQEVVNEAQTPVLKGGKMRVKTGFLRGSGVATVNELPRGQSKGDKNKTYTWDGQQLIVALEKMKLGDVFYFGWTANYAKYREAYDAFLDSALQNWQIHVNTSIERFKK